MNARNFWWFSIALVGFTAIVSYFTIPGRFYIFLLLWSIIWALLSPVLYGFIGPEWWRKDAREYKERVLWLGDLSLRATPITLFIMLIEICIPLAVAWFLFLR